MTKLASLFLAAGLVVAGCSLGVDEVPFSEGEGEDGEGEGEAAEGEGDSATGEGEGEGEAPSVTLTLNTFAVVGETITVSAENLTLVGAIDPTTCTFSTGEGAERRPLENGALTVDAGGNVVHVECDVPSGQVTSDFTVRGWALESFELTSGGAFTVVTRGVDADTLQLECDLGATSIVVGDTGGVQLSATTNVVPSPTANVTVFPSAHLTVSCASTAEGATATEMSGPSADVHVAPSPPTYALSIVDDALSWVVTSSGAGACSLDQDLGAGTRVDGAANILILPLDVPGLTADVSVTCTDGVGGPSSERSAARDRVFVGSLTAATASALLGGTGDGDDDATILIGDLNLDGEAGSGTDGTAYAFPRLTAVSGFFKLSGDTAAGAGFGVDFTALRLIGGSFDVVGNPDLIGLTVDGASSSQASFPTLEHVVGNFTILNNANLAVAAFPELTRVGSAVEGTGAVSLTITGNGAPFTCDQRKAFACNLLPQAPSVFLGTACDCP